MREMTILDYILFPINGGTIIEDKTGEWRGKMGKLYWALRSRVLTSAEMAEVAEWGELLFATPGIPHAPGEHAKELNEALLQQFRLRAAAAKEETSQTSADPLPAPERT